MQSSKQRLASLPAVAGLFVIFCGVLLLALPLHAQVTTADVRGVVTDPQNAAVADAEVTITNADTGFSRTVTTGSDGAYNFTDLPIGPYRLRVARSGFKASEHTGIVLHVNDSLVINVSLSMGAVTETMTVEAYPIAVETTTGALSGLIQGSQVAELPLNGRSFTQLVTLVPGVAAGEIFSAQNKGLLGGSDLSISGSSANGNLWLVDGANNNDTGSNRTILVYPSVDAIEEFKIERNSYGAEFGLNAGAQINVVTKSGTNDFHGSVYYYGRNDALNTFDSILKAGCPTCEKNKLRRNDFGYTVGGPIKRDKIFFFFSEEWNRQIDGVAVSSHVPTVAERTGDFSGVAACPGNTNGFNDAGFPVAGLNDPDPTHPAGPLTPIARPTNIPAGRLSPVGQLLTQMYPAPTLSDPCVFTNWTAAGGRGNFWREESIRGDINLTKSMSLMLRFTNDAWNLGTPSAGFGWGSNPLGVIDESWEQPGRLAVGRLSKTFGSGMVNDFQFTYSANRITITQSNPALVQQLNQAIPTFFPLSGKRYGDQGPSVWFQGTAHLPNVWTIAPWQNQQDLLTWQDDLSVVKSRHTFKFGGSFSHNLKNEQAPNVEFGAFTGIVGYNGCTVITQPNCGTLNGFRTDYDVSDVLLQNMAVGFNETDTIFLQRTRWRNFEAYAGDNWRVNNRLTVVYGVRYSYLPNPYLADDLYTVFNPAAFDPALPPGAGGTCNGLLFSPNVADPCSALGLPGGAAASNRALWENDKDNFAPRLSVAWDPTGSGKWAIRAGAGQFFNRDRLFILQISGNNPPFIGNFTASNGRFLDVDPNTPAGRPPACGPPPAPPAVDTCFSAGRGSATIGNENSSNMPNSWQWNISVQRELWRNARLEVGYVGNRNVHWELIGDVNAVPASDRLAYVQATGNDALRRSFRPFGSLRGDNALTFYTRGGSSSYHGLQTLFNSRFHRNSTVQVAYTFSKLISLAQLLDTPPNNVDFYDPSANRGPDVLNRTHIFSLNLIYFLPALQDQNRFVRNALGSWEIGTILSQATGPNMTPIIGGLPNVGGDPSGTGGAGQLRPMRVPGEPCRGQTGDDRQWLNPNAFTMNGFQLGQIGSSGVGICTGPGNNNVDFSILKNFRLTERFKMQFRMEFFNLFNHAQYRAASIGPGGGSQLNPGITFNASNTPGNEQFLDAAGNPTTSVANAVSIQNTTVAPGFGMVTQSRENGFRQIQYALKFIF